MVTVISILQMTKSKRGEVSLFMVDLLHAQMLSPFKSSVREVTQIF